MSYDIGQKKPDMVKVVRCNECRYRGLSIECPMCFEECYDYDGYNEYHTIDNAVDDGFCDRGERWSEDAE